MAHRLAGGGWRSSHLEEDNRRIFRSTDGSKKCFEIATRVKLQQTALA